MLNDIFQGLFESSTLSTADFLVCIFAALALGLLIALAYRFRSESTPSFMMTLAILPALVTVVIMMVNGNIGAGVAVAGAFSLIRFRSAPGSAREIAAIFLAMGTGLITGMGYIAYAALFAIIMCAALMIYTATGFGSPSADNKRVLRITIPEDLDYVGVFDKTFDDYTSRRDLVSVKTSNMGSLFKLRYDIELRDGVSEKDFIDQLRTRNGNLEISMSMGEKEAPSEL